MLVIVLVLLAWGLLSILSASAPVAESELHHSLYYVQRQGMWCVFGLTLMLLAATADLAFVRFLAKPLLILTAVLLLATQIPGLGVTELGSSRWLRFGPLSVQPSELAKLSLALYLADILARHSDLPWTSQSLRQAFFPAIAVLGLVLVQPDLGTTIVLAFSAFVLFYSYGTRLAYMVTAGAIATSAVLYISWSTPYQRLRWLGFLNPWSDPQGNGYQLVQSLMAIGSGGILGQGWGQSKQKLFYLPIQYADFIFAVMAEELGLVGGLALLVLFFALAWRGISIAGKSKDPFLALLAIALTSTVVAQAFINLGVVTASLPTTGIPLPFMSFGGSSLTITLISMGLLLNISRQIQRQAESTPVEPSPTA
ncbi:MAG: putative lipid II flippase FtsW [Candidatus Sericytochromatia bacterium]|nr:putative lipid II flippase FtsW [Candidatus Sericytochromatia bacterium]